MKCTKCGNEMEYYDHFDEEYHREHIDIRWRFHCPNCNHNIIALVTYQIENIEVEWD